MLAPLDTRRARRRSWAVAAAGALVGWPLVVLLVAVGVRPLGWALIGAAAAALALTAFYARASRLGALGVAGLAFACIVLEWPVLAVVTLLIAGPGQEA